MPLSVVELFGYFPADQSEAAIKQRSSTLCPFVQGRCIKMFKSGLISGACTLRPTQSGPVICCPNRLYAEDYKVLLDVAFDAFGEGMRLCRSTTDAVGDGRDVVVFGKKWGKELRLPSRAARGGFSVDWILAKLDTNCALEEFVAVELQTMDTTGSYEAQVHRFLSTGVVLIDKQSNINWENVNKRILPQLIYKGHVLRQEALCKKGLYFICPSPVYERILIRLGGNLRPYPPQPGALTFRQYDLGQISADGSIRQLEFKGQMTTTVDQVAFALSSPDNLPPAGVYEKAIRTELGA